MPLARRLLLVATVASAAGAVGACRSGTAARASTPASAPTVLLFSNQSQYEAGVYIVAQSGPRRRIGTVMPGRTDSLVIRPGTVPIASTVAIVARLLAANATPSSGPLALRQGDRLSVTLPPAANTLNVLPLPEEP